LVSTLDTHLPSTHARDRAKKQPKFLKTSVMSVNATNEAAVEEPISVNVNATDEAAVEEPISVNVNATDEAAVEEPISVVDDTRYRLFPIRHDDIWNLYNRQKNKFWTPEEIDFSADAKSWDTLNEDEQHFVGHTLAFFANSDNIVVENIFSRLLTDLVPPEFQACLSMQACMEMIHVTTYNLCIDSVIQDEQKKMSLFNAVSENEVVKPKLQWAMRWVGSKATLARRLVAWSIVEGVFFSSSFASLFWLRKRQKVPGICFANEKIVEDEALHVMFATTTYREHIRHKLPPEEVHAMFDEAVRIESDFVEQSLPVGLIGMNSVQMKEYVQSVADLVLGMLGVDPLYKKQNPFTWMEGLGLIGKANFFEKRVAEYVKTGPEREIRTTGAISMLGDDL
jgi:ribonucleotide reductase beta subunit family protein with ferritin-like domain